MCSSDLKTERQRGETQREGRERDREREREMGQREKHYTVPTEINGVNTEVQTQGFVKQDEIRLDTHTHIHTEKNTHTHRHTHLQQESSEEFLYGFSLGVCTECVCVCLVCVCLVCVHQMKGSYCCCC